MFTTPPAPSDWVSQLGGQTRVAVTPVEALNKIAEIKRMAEKEE